MFRKVVVYVILGCLPVVTNAAWEYAHKKDVMEDTVTHFAITRSTNSLSLNAPYGGSQHPMIRHFITARNGVVEENHLVLTLERGQFSCYTSGIGEMCSVTIKIEDKPSFQISASLNTYGGKRNELVLDVGEDELFSILKAKRIRIAADMYEEGTRHIMDFNTSGYNVEKHLRIKISNN